LADHDPSTHQVILEEIAAAQNALAVPYFQAPLTSLSPRDRAILLAWGAYSAQTQFGYLPKGVFLPSFAADSASLEAIHAVGFEFILLRPNQVDHLPWPSASAVQVAMSSGRHLTAFIVNEGLGDSLLTEMVERGGAGYWSHRYLARHARHADPLTVLYVEGEWLGQHRMCEADFIYYLCRSEAPSVSFRPTSLAAYYDQMTQPLPEVELAEIALEPLSETQRSLALSLTALMHESDELLEGYKGDWEWLLEYATLAQLAAPQDPALQTYYHLRQGWANCQQLERYPQLSVENILQDAAFSIDCLFKLTGINLRGVFSATLLPHLRQTFEHMADDLWPAESLA
jgi:hypothetical protein